MKIKYSFIVPVYNRPQEIEELLESMKNLYFPEQAEILIIEDGSGISSEHIIEKYPQLNIKYFNKENTGPGDSRNYGMERATGNYFLILDSDVVLPPHYLNSVDDFLKQKIVDFFGGPDAAHPSFSNFQKAVNYAMTSLFTTGGIRGNNDNDKNYEPRSFNMGISKKAFQESGGFGKIHPGEDPDLSLRLKKLGFKSGFIKSAYVFHKRRIDFSKFKNQVKKFGLVRPILMSWHPECVKPSFFFPSLFILGFFFSLLLLVFGIFAPFLFYLAYFVILFIDSLLKTKSISIACIVIPVVFVQFYGYGIGFIQSFLNINIFKKNPEKIYPFLFFKK